MSIKGIPVTLYVNTVTGKDDFNQDIVTSTTVTVNNVVIGQPSSQDVLNEYNLSGKTISYMLAIPADDTHVWENTIVEFYGRKFRTVGIADQYMYGFMGKNFPWNKRIKVEEYE